MTTFCPTRLVALVLVSFAMVSAAATPAIARQSDSDLRKENQQLTTKVQDLQNELDAARHDNEALKQQIAQLEQQIAALRRSSGGSGTAPATSPVVPEQVSVDESVPTASPRALFHAILDSYDKTMGGADIGKPGDAKRRMYLKKVEGWRSAANRDFRAPITWHVRFIDGRSAKNGDRIATLVVVDPKTDVRLGNQFDVLLSKLFADRLDFYKAHGGLDNIVMVLRGTVIPDIRINEERAARGSFDNPPFIGPFAEFIYSVDVKSLMAAKDDEKEQPASKPKEPARTPSAPSKTSPGKP